MKNIPIGVSKTEYLVLGNMANKSLIEAHVIRESETFKYLNSYLAHVIIHQFNTFNILFAFVSFQ